MQVVDVNGNMFGYDHLEIIGADGRPKTLDSGLTSVGLSMPSAFSVSNSPLTSNGTIGVTGAGTISQYIDGTGALRTFPSLTGYVTAVTASAPLSSSGGTTPNITIPQANISTSGFLSFTDWNTFNSKQPAGNYITALSGEATGSGPGTASVTLNNASVTAKVLTGVNVTGGSINASDSILTAFGKLQNQINGLIGSSIYQGTWNALTNTPALTSGVGTRGYYYIVNVAGSTNLDGITDWNVGDWAIFDGTAWQQVDNTDSVTSVNGQTGAVSLTSDNIPEGVTNLYFTNLRARQSLSLTTTGSSGASTYDNTTGVLNVPNYTLSGIGGVPLSRTLTINGTAYDLSADRSWSVGTVTSVAMTVPTGLTVAGSPITGSGTFALGLQSGYSIPTTANQSNWTTAYNRSIVSAAVNYGVAATSIVLTQQNTGTVTANLIAGGATTNDFVFFNGSNLAYTQLNTTAPLSFNGATKTFSISQAGASTNGFLSSTDWNTFNNKQNAITLTTTGSSGAATLIGSTLNIPNYSSALSGYVPTSRQLTINGTSYDLSADRSWSVGTVTSIGVTAGPRIVSEDGPITSSGNITISHGIGQGLDVQGAQDLMNRSIEDGGSFEAFRCLATSLGELGDFETPLGTFNSIGTVVQNIMLDEFGHILGIGSKTLYTSDIIEDTNLYFTDARARAAISLTTTGTGGAATYNSSTGVLNIPQYQSVITNPVTGTGTANYVARWTSSSQIGTGVLYDNGTNVGIGTASPSSKLEIRGDQSASKSSLLLLSKFDYGTTTFFQNYSNTFYANGKSLEIEVETLPMLQLATNNAATQGKVIFPNGNVGIGTNTPGDKLTVDGNINSRNTALFFGDGSDNSASVFATGGPVKFFANSSERMRINSVGQLLVGTTSGYSSNGKIVVQNGTIAAGSSNWNNSTTGNAIEVFGDTNSNGGTIWSLANGNQVWGNISISPLGGNVGIGTYTPSQKLHVAGNILSSNVIYWNNGVGALSWDTGLVTMETNSATAIAFNTNSSERMRITAAGNVGIGTTAPAYKLDVVGDIRLPENNYLYFGNTSNFIRRDSSNILTVAGSSSVYLTTSGSTRVAVMGSGDVGIGTTSPDVKLHVVGTSFVPTTMKLVHSQSFGAPQTLSLSSNSTGVSSLDLSFANPFAINIGGSEMMRIAANGSVGVGTTAPDTSSIMDLSSRRQGFLPPRMTNSEMNSIGSPATGLIVYDTTNNKVTVYNGSSWVPLH